SARTVVAVPTARNGTTIRRPRSFFTPTSSRSALASAWAGPALSVTETDRSRFFRAKAGAGLRWGERAPARSGKPSRRSLSILGGGAATPGAAVGGHEVSRAAEGDVNLPAPDPGRTARGLRDDRDRAANPRRFRLSGAPRVDRAGRPRARIANRGQGHEYRRP